jgi:hypothetical protein
MTKLRLTEINATEPYNRQELSQAILWGDSYKSDRYRVLPWNKYSRTLDPGWGVIVEPGGPPVDEHGTLVVPVRRVYFMNNETTLVRVADNAVIECYGCSISIDVDSWGWQFSAQVAHTAWALVTDASQPLIVRATVNGWSFDSRIERVTRNREFGKTALTISGRSPLAELAAPYARPQSWLNTEARTAQQLAEETLEFTGYTLDWAIADWLVPAGAWAFTGTPIDAINKIAQAAGGTIQADPSSSVIHVVKRYPSLPWNWSTAIPDVELPLDIVVQEDLESVVKPNYNAVYVSGASQGIVGHIKRTGTAGDVVAAMQTDPLITHVDAARGRGESILSDTGEQRRLTLSLPLSADIDLIKPGQLIHITESGGYRALSRSVSVSATRGSVRQTVELEQHLIEEE